MDVNNNSASLNNFNLGNHICCIYRTNDELFSLIIPFFIDGLQKGNQCIYILGQESPEEITNAFKAFGFDLSNYILNKDFIFKSNEDMYLKNGTFNVTDVTSNLVEAESEALKQGYSALRIAGSASWATENALIIPELIKYESIVNDFIESSFIIAACLYKESLFDNKTLVNTLYNHPLVYLYDKLIENKYFIYPNSQEDLDSKELNYEEITRALHQQG